MVELFKTTVFLSVISACSMTGQCIFMHSIYIFFVFIFNNRVYIFIRSNILLLCSGFPWFRRQRGSIASVPEATPKAPFQSGLGFPQKFSALCQLFESLQKFLCNLQDLICISRTCAFYIHRHHRLMQRFSQKNPSFHIVLPE